VLRQMAAVGATWWATWKKKRLSAFVVGLSKLVTVNVTQWNCYGFWNTGMMVHMRLCTIHFGKQLFKRYEEPNISLPLEPWWTSTKRARELQKDKKMEAYQGWWWIRTG
jgi:hypothetical protein